MKRLRLFIDTEFTDFKDRDLISLGMVAETGEEFYGENLDYRKAWASDFVKQHVLPLCNFEKHGKHLSALSTEAWLWLDNLPCDEIILMVDYSGDHELLRELFVGDMHPKINEIQNVFDPLMAQLKVHQSAGISPPEKFIESGRTEYELGFFSYFLNTKEIQHHALSDAKANLHGFNRMMQHIGLYA